MDEKSKIMYGVEEYCTYCGYNVADKECKHCQEKYCSECLDENDLCPYCGGRDTPDFKMK